MRKASVPLLLTRLLAAASPAIPRYGDAQRPRAQRSAWPCRGPVPARRTLGGDRYSVRFKTIDASENGVMGFDGPLAARRVGDCSR